MSVDERSRLQLAEAVKRALGDDEGITLMELLPPVGWADVATKHDLLMLERRMDGRFESLEARMNARFERFEARMDARFERVDARFESLEHKFMGELHRELNRQTWKMFSINAAAMSVVIGALIAALRF